jgi:hypothetical protein
LRAKATVPRFFIVFNLTAGRVKQINFKMTRIMFAAFAVGLGLTANLWAQVPNYVPTNGLVGWWPFNGNANDESGNGNNGTVNGATLTTDRFGVANKAYQFLNNNLVENITTNFSGVLGQNNRSISFWFKQDIININNQSVFCGYGDYNPNITHSGFSATTANGKIGLDANAVFTYYDYVPSANWNHAVYVYENGNNISQVKIYLNGNILSIVAFSTGNQNTTLNTLSGTLFRINGAQLSTKFIGDIDDIGFWNRALTGCEIADLYNDQINSVAGSIAVSPNSTLIGSNVTLSTASNSTNLQWQSNPSNYGWQNVPSNSTYNGETTNTLTVSNVQLANHNQPFRIIASLGNCTDTSNIATIQIADTCITNVTVYDTLLTTVTDTLIINTTLSLPAPNNENTILIYPNPASDHITIDNGNFAVMAGYSIKIENNAGQQVFQNAINQAQFYVDLSTWTGNGLYFVHLIDPQNNTVTVRKIVLQ